MNTHANHTVCLSFDFDAISGWLNQTSGVSPGPISRGEFGAIAAPRILKMLEHYGIHSTWFVPGHTAETYPDVVRNVSEHGHEIGHHGYCHESPINLNLADERQILQKGIDAIQRVIGKRPIGYRSPAWDMSPNTVDLLRELGFLYDSSLMGNDFSPYWCRRGDIYALDKPFHFGESVDLVEMPVTWGLDDFPAFEFVSRPNQVFPGLRAPSEIYEIWAGDFDYMIDNIPGGVYTLTMHPEVIGRGHRLLLLEKLINHMLQSPGTHFECMDGVVRSWKEQIRHK